MREFAVLFISLALLALEYYLGTRRKPLLGALLPGELGHLLFPTLVLLLLWLEGHLAAKKRELARMKATDL